VIASRQDRNNCPALRFHSSTIFLCSTGFWELAEAEVSEADDALNWASGGMARQKVNYTGAPFFEVPTKIWSDCSMSIFNATPNRLKSEIKGSRSVTVRFF
jgi:hypothetical protein